MEKQKFINFAEISKQIPFTALLNHLNIKFEETEKEVKTDKIIVNKSKNLVFYKDTKKGGSVINLYSDLMKCDLRTAATHLQDTFLKERPEPKREIPTLALEYDQDVANLNISEDMAKNFEIGKVKGRSVLAGCIAFRLYEEDNTPRGYVGLKGKEWVFPKGSKRGDIVYNLNRAKTDYAILVADILECLHLIEIGYPFTVALMSLSATDEQINLLGNSFKRILVIHKQPENIANRLCRNCFVKIINKSDILKLNKEEVKLFF